MPIYNEANQFHMNVLRRSGGSPVDLWFTGIEPAAEVSGTLITDGPLFSVLVNPETIFPQHGSFQAHVYTSSGVRGIKGFAIRSSPNKVRLFLSGKVEHRERRDSSRVPLEIPVTYRLLKYGDNDLTGMGGQGEGVSIDVGVSGMAIVTGIRLPEGLTIGVAFVSPEWDMFPPLPCMVNRVEKTLKGWRTGLGFDRPDPEFKAYVKKFVLHSLRAAKGN